MKAVLIYLLVTVPCIVNFGGVHQGKVLNMEEKPLKALVYLKVCYDNFTQSDAQGVFRLEIPDEFMNDSIVIFAPGYLPLVTVYNQIDTLITYRLEESSIAQDARLHHLTNAGLKMVVSDAVESIWSYTPNKSHELKAFCRVTSYKGSRLLSLTESAMTIYDKAYTNNFQTIKIRVDQLRQSDNYDSNKYKVPGNHVEVLSFNPIYRAYESNYIRLVQKYGSIFNSSLYFIIDKNFRLADVEQRGDKLLLRIHYYGDYGGFVPGFKEYGYLVVDYDSKTIHGFERILYDGEILLNKVTVLFDDYDGKLYPKSIVTYAQKPGLITDLSNFVYDATAIWIHNVDVKKSKSVDEVEPRMKYVYPPRYSYEKSFWETYSQLKIHPLEKKVIDAFGGIENLAEQFERNGALSKEVALSE